MALNHLSRTLKLFSPVARRTASQHIQRRHVFAGPGIGDKSHIPRPPFILKIYGRAIDSAFLRDSCTCPHCVNPDSKQKLFQTSDVPVNIEATLSDWRGDIIELAWSNDVPGFSPEHRTRVSEKWLQAALDVEMKLMTPRHDNKVLWDLETISKEEKLFIEYKDWMDSDKGLFDALTFLNKYGLLFLRNVPDSEKSVEEIAGRIGTLKDTFYGRTWDVKSKPKAKNIAYTQSFLGLHMDLL